MPAPISEALLAELQNVAEKYAPGVLKKFGLPSSKVSSEDIVNEFMTKFWKDDFITRYDLDVCGLNYYVYLGVRNVAVSMQRKYKYELLSIEQLQNPVKDIQDSHDRMFEVADPNPASEQSQELILEELFQGFEDFPFGYPDKSAEIKDEEGLVVEVFPPMMSSILKLMYRGFEKKDIAKLFSVSTATIRHRLKEFKDQMRGKHPGRYPDAEEREEERKLRYESAGFPVPPPRSSKKGVESDASADDM